MDETSWSLPATGSGSVLPLLLRKKWSEQQNLEMSALAPATHLAPQTASDDIALQPYPASGSAEAAETNNRIFKAQELEDCIWKTTVAMVDIQRQIHRGEETYYEETYAHGNLFRGWDAFVDAKDVGLGGNGSSSVPPGGGANRRVPADARWFSGSCRSVSRNSRPTPLNRSGVRTASGAINNNTPTLNSTPTAWTESGTPTSVQPEPDNATGRTSPTPKKKKTELPAASEGGKGPPESLPTSAKSTDQTEMELAEPAMIAQELSTTTDSASKKPKGPPVRSENVEKTILVGISDTTESITSDVAPSVLSTNIGVDTPTDTVSPVKKKKKDSGSTVDIPIVEKNDPPNGAPAETEADTETTAKANANLKSPASAPKDKAEKKSVPKEGSKKQGASLDKEGEASKGNEAGHEEDDKQEDPFKRRITRKRKSISESDN
jgi:Histone acetyltransferase subunit NuA4